MSCWGCCALNTPAQKMIAHVHDLQDSGGESEIALPLTNFRSVLRRVVSFQITVLKVLAGHPGGRASIADLRHAVAILMSSGSDWTDRTKRLAARAPGLDIFSQSFVLRDDAGWQITDAGRAFLASVETPIQMTADNERPAEAVCKVGAVAGIAPDKASCRKPARPASSGAGPDATFRGRIISCSARHNQSRLVALLQKGVRTWRLVL